MRNFGWCLAGIILVFVSLFVFGVSPDEKEKESTFIQDTRLGTNMTVTDIEKETAGKSGYNYYLYTKKNENTYKFNVTEKQYLEVKNLSYNESLGELDIMFSQGPYAEKTVVGISFSIKRR